MSNNKIISKLKRFSNAKLLLLLLLAGCVEEFIPEDITFEDILVVEATLTDEFKFHEVKLSRTFRFNQTQPFESGAEVKLVDDQSSEYIFVEANAGTYISTNEFAIQSGRTYTLKIVTTNNESYTSLPVTLPSNTSQVTEVTYTKAENSVGEEGVEILVDSFDPSGNAKYYRYELEETYRINPPFWAPHEAIILSSTPPFDVDFGQRQEEERVCFNTIYSSNIIQTQTNSLTESRVTKFPVQFIQKNASIIRDRYSILVRQYTQSLEAFLYYETFNEFSSSESVFTENQPGFLDGNILSETNPNEKVLGFLEISSVSTKRLFFNYKDVFPNENKPVYFVECEEPVVPLLTDPNNPEVSPLLEMLNTGEYEVYDLNFEFFTGELSKITPFHLVKRECSDCTVLGTNIKPDFWID